MSDTDPSLRNSVTSLWAEQRNRSGFLATATPSLSWQVTNSLGDWRQHEYEIEIRRADTTHRYARNYAESQNVAWPGTALSDYDSASVRVRAKGVEGGWSEWCDWVTLETGPLTPADWQADFIASPVPADEKRGVTRFRSEFTMNSEVASAILSATAHGIYEVSINGVIAGDEVLAPGWTSYDSRLLFQSYDVSDLVTTGRNVIGATVAEGWYHERFGFDGNFSEAYKGPLALSAQLRIQYTDGTVEFVTSSTDWTTSLTGPTTSATIYQGERYDARLRDDALSLVGAVFADAAPAVRVAADSQLLRPSFAPPVRRIETVEPIDIILSPSGGTIIDFGQNLVGWLTIRVDAPAGTEITLHHAEVLEDGELGTRPLRFASATDSYVAAGEDGETWSPRFTFHGFRYAQVTGWLGAFSASSVSATVVHSDMMRTGHLETSNTDLNKLHQNVLWGMRGNFLSLPTDCPQRDERLGWTGDIQVFAPTASYLYDSAGFLRNWLTDLALEQGLRGGVVPMVVPSPNLPSGPATAAWGDSATLVPDTLFERFGDPAVLLSQYESMRSWVEGVRCLAGSKNLWTGGFQFGDWLDPAAPPENPAAAKTDPDIVATAYYYRSTRALARAARELGRTSDEAEYGILAESIREAFQREYVTEGGRLVSDAHSAYAIAITFGLLDDERLRRAGNRLAELVRAYGYRIRTGFVGTPLICEALCDSGHSDIAYRLLMETGCPSWLYPISMGATTIWERWDSMLPDGSINPGEMTSFNHYALGAVADWMERSIGGIAPAEPGYRVTRVAPILGGGITWSRASLATGYGQIAVHWEIVGNTFTLSVQVPANTSALVRLPGAVRDLIVGSGSHSWSVQIPAVDDAVRAPLSMASNLADLMDDNEARRAIEALFAKTGYGIGLGWTESGRWRRDSTLDSSLIMFSPENRERLVGVLDALNDARAAGSGQDGH